MTDTPDRVHDDRREPVERVTSATAALREADPAASIDWDAVDVQDLLQIPDLNASGTVLDQADGGTRVGLPDRRRPRRTAAAVGGAVALVAAGGLVAAAAAGFFDGPRPEVAGVQCLSGSSARVLGAIGSASPIDACVAAWKDSGEVPTDLVMASLPGQMVIVVPRAELPSGATILDGAPAIDPRTAELSDALADQIRGVDLGTACRSADDVGRRITQITEELGVGRIPVTQREEGGACAFAALDSTGDRILVFLRPAPVAATHDAAAVEARRQWDLYVADLARLTRKPGVRVGELKASAEAAARDRLGIGTPGKEPFHVDVVRTTVGTTPRLYLRGGGEVRIYAPE